ncbi:hypothetical protein TTHERM_001094821 (macronuclear) [Tetrahymena thermophila SB210]|uniref:Uncharacterized protein n=1 Tax=Tetrahymena thermophila (strain SB210) TaxID=312017 RepID=W7X8L7_TETTS|nr:hypothetical protein TTHERM_001094821 [Tetrahymena thermophila SB210]EWS75710.1 hypothetical protein TTHERM_001094821 [Tetrahymena thermophila SB210]|eukprot:XP_012651752.1 hypothetical protein TTHERM_001094821 [Tetrahymena thermophila SB210]
MSQQKKVSEKISTLTARQFISDFRKKNSNCRLSFDSQELRKTQPIKVSRLKSTNIEQGDQNSILNDYSSIEAISQNHMRFSKQTKERKNSQYQSTFFDSSSIKEYLNQNQFGTSQSRTITNQNIDILKFLKIDSMNTTLQNSGQLSIQKSESARFQQSGQFLFTQYNSNTFREDSILDGVKRRQSQSIQPNNSSILRDLHQKSNSHSQQNFQKDEYYQTYNSENAKQSCPNQSPLNKGNIITFAVGKNNQDESSSQILKSKDVEKIIQLRQQGIKLKKKENFYMQLISNDEIALPKYEKEFPSIRREKYLESLKQEQKNQFSGQKNPFLIQLEDGSILDIEKVKNMTDSLQKSHRLVYHNSQNSQFKKPDERKDTKILSEWLDNMINKVYNEQITSYYDFYEKFELIFDGIISEISRQLKSTCSERAQLLTKVWSIYSTVISEFFQKTQQTNIKIESENFKRVNNVHKMYLNDIVVQNQQIKELYEKLETKENYMNKLRSENRYLRKKWQKLEKGNEYQQQHLEQYMQMYEDVVKENQGLKMRIEGIMFTQQNDYLDQFSRNDIQDRFQDEIEKIRTKLFEYFSNLYDEQKSKLMEAYQLRQNLKEKEILLAQKIEEEDEEYQKNLKNKLKMDQESVDDNILDNKCVDTSDLFKTDSKCVDTSSLVKYENAEIQATPAPIKQVSVQIQVAPKIVSREIQADIRTLITNNESLSLQDQQQIQLINENFIGFIQNQFYLNYSKLEKQNDLNLIQLDFLKFKEGCQQILSKIPLKQEYSQQDSNNIADYIDGNISKIYKFITSIFATKNAQTKISKNLQIGVKQNHMEILVNANRVVLYHMYQKFIKQNVQNYIQNDTSSEQNDDFFKNISKKVSVTSFNNLEMDKIIKSPSNLSDSLSHQKSSFYKLQRASKNLIVGFQFLKEASIKKGQEKEEKIDNYHKYQQIAQDFENKYQQIAQDFENKQEIQKKNSLIYEKKDEKLIQLNKIEKSFIQESNTSNIKLSSFQNKIVNTKNKEELSESDQSDSESESESEKSSSGSSQSDESNESSEIQKKSSHIILTEINLKSQKNLQIQNQNTQNQSFFQFITNQEEQKGEANNLNMNFTQNQKKESISLSPIKLDKKNTVDKNNESSQFEQLSISKNISRIKEEEEFYVKRRSSVLSQIIDNARVSLTLDIRNKTSSFSQEQTPKKIPEIQINNEDEDIQLSKSSPKALKITNQKNQANEKISTQQLLRELKLITPVENIFKRLRVSINSNKITRQSTRIIEKVIQKINKKPNQALDLKEQKINNILKVFGNIMVELMKYLKKNTNNTFPFFHAFSFDYFINNYGNQLIQINLNQFLLKLILSFRLRKMH